MGRRRRQDPSFHNNQRPQGSHAYRRALDARSPIRSSPRFPNHLHFCWVRIREIRRTPRDPRIHRSAEKRRKHLLQLLLFDKALCANSWPRSTNFNPRPIGLRQGSDASSGGLCRVGTSLAGASASWTILVERMLMQQCFLILNFNTCVPWLTHHLLSIFCV